MKTIRKETQKENRGSRKAALIASVILTGAVAITATGCQATITADGKEIGRVEVTGSDANITVDTSVNKDQDEMPSVPAAKNNEGEASFDAPVAGESEDNIAAADPVYGEHDNDDGAADPSNDRSGSDVEVPQDKATLQRLGEDEAMLFNMNENFFYSKCGDYGVFGIEFTDAGKVVFYINGNRFEMDTPCSKHTCPYLLKHNGQAYIYIEYLMDDGCEIWSYAISDYGIVYAGHSDKMYLDREMTSAKSFWACETYGDDAVVDITRRFTVGRKGLPTHADKYCYFGTRRDIFPAYDLTGYVVKNGAVTSEKAVVSKDDSVWLVKANEIEWLDLRKEDGTVIRVNIENLFLNYYTESNERWIYDAIKDTFKLREDKAASDNGTPKDNKTPADDGNARQTYAGSIDDLQNGWIFKFNVSGSKRVLDSNCGYYEISASGKSVEIGYNGKSYTCGISCDDKAIMAEAYLFKTNDLAYIYVESILEDCRIDINTYLVDEDYISYVGSVAKLCIAGDMKNTDSFDCYIYDGMNGVFSLKRTYKVSAKNGMPMPADPTFHVASFAEVKMKNDMTGNVYKDGRVTAEEMTIKAGTTVKPVKVLALQYLEVVDPEGNTVWLDMEDIFVDTYEKEGFTWIIKALFQVLEPA